MIFATSTACTMGSCAIVPYNRRFGGSKAYMYIKEKLYINLPNKRIETFVQCQHINTMSCIHTYNVLKMFQSLLQMT